MGGNFGLAMANAAGQRGGLQMRLFSRATIALSALLLGLHPFDYHLTGDATAVPTCAGPTHSLAPASSGVGGASG